jgi:hypothetical protein
MPSTLFYNSNNSNKTCNYCRCCCLTVLDCWDDNEPSQPGCGVPRPLLWPQLPLHPVGGERDKLAGVKQFGNASSDWTNAGSLLIHEVDEIRLKWSAGPSSSNQNRQILAT